MGTGDSVRTLFRKALKACILEIQPGSYRVGVSNVFDPPIGLEKMTQFPCANIYYGQERTERTELAGNNALLNLRLDVAIDVFLSEINDPETAIDGIIADFQEYFGNNYYIQPTRWLHFFYPPKK